MRYATSKAPFELPDDQAAHRNTLEPRMAQTANKHEFVAQKQIAQKCPQNEVNMTTYVQHYVQNSLRA